MKDELFKTNVQLLSSFMRTTERAIVNKFAKLPRAVKLDLPQMLPAVYVPGTRKDRVLLVAHYDTVWDGARIKLENWGSMMVSAHSKVGIGADDRAGIAALWELRNSGHSLLLVPDEEVGCMGSAAVIHFHADKLKDERFALQFDRCGARDLVFYECNNPKFTRFMEQNMPGYRVAQGSVSDISVLCPALNIAGCNISIGFEYEHTASEQLDVLDWYRTVTTAKGLLAGHCPPYVYKRRRYTKKGSRYGRDQYGNMWGQVPPYDPHTGKFDHSYGGDQFDTAHQLDGSRDDFEAWDQYQRVMDGESRSDNNDEAYYWCRDCASLYDHWEINDHTTCNSCGGPLSPERYNDGRS